MKTITVKALGLTGPKWIERLEKKGYKISSYAKQLLESEEWNKHRLEEGSEHTVELVTIPNGEWKSTAKLKQGRIEPKGELALLLREALSDKDIEEIGVWYVAVLHDPIKDADVLLVIEVEGKNHELPSDGNWRDERWIEIIYAWNFRNDSLEAQSLETIEFIASLLNV